MLDFQIPTYANCAMQPPHIYYQSSNSADACSRSNVYGTLLVMAVFKKQFASLYAVKLASNVSPWHGGDLFALLYVPQLPTQESRLYSSDSAMLDVEETKSTKQYSSKEYDDEPIWLVYCVLLIAGQLRARMLLVGTAKVDVDVVDVIVAELVDTVVVVDRGDGDVVAEELLLFRAWITPTVPPTAAPMTMSATTIRARSARPWRMPHHRFGEILDTGGCWSSNFVYLGA